MDEGFIVSHGYRGFRAMMTKLPGQYIMAVSRYPEPPLELVRCVS